MGFSWASFVAQSYLIYLVAGSGLQRSAALAPCAPAPPSASLMWAASTDDLMFFSDEAGVSEAVVRQLDAHVAAKGVVGNPAKDVNDATDAACLGVRLADGRRWETEPTRLWSLLADYVAVAGNPRCSARQMQEYLGSLQWLCMMQRLIFSVLQDVHLFAAHDDANLVRDLPAASL